MEKSLAIFETKGFAAALAASEVILIDNKIELIKIVSAGGGIVSQFFTGDYDELKDAISKGIKNGREAGEIISVHIVKKINENIEELLFKPEKTSSHISDDSMKTKNKKEKMKETKTEVEQPQFAEDRKPSEELNLFEKQIEHIKTKPIKSKLSSASSTIQRLREEALSSVKPKRKSVSAESTVEKPLTVNLNKLSELNVHELRHEARKYKSFPIQGRQISRANRKELLKYFEEIS